MNNYIQVLWKSNDVTSDVIHYNRKKDLCSSIGELEFHLALGTRTYTSYSDYIQIGDEVTVYESTIKKGEFTVTSVATNSDGTTIVRCQDYSKRIADYYISEPYYNYNAWIKNKEALDMYLPYAQISYSYSTTDTGQYISDNTTFGMTNLYDFMIQMFQQAGWYGYFNNNNEFIITDLKKSSDDSEHIFYETDIINIRNDVHDKQMRNKAVILGDGNTTWDGYVAYSKTRLSGYERDANDIRTVAVINSNIHTYDTCVKTANTVLDTFASLTSETQVTVIGTYDIDLNTVVSIDMTDNFDFEYQGIVVSYEVKADNSGVVTDFVLGRKCPRIFGYYDFSPTYSGMIINTPYFENPKGQLNVDTNIHSTSNLLFQTKNLMYGVQNASVYLNDTYSFTNGTTHIHKVHTVSRVDSSIDNDYMYEPYERYVAVSENVGIFAQSYNNTINIFDVDFSSGTLTLRTTYTIEEPLGNRELGYMCGVAKYGDSIRLVFDVIDYSVIEEPYAEYYYTDFIVFNNDTSTFSYITGRKEVGDNYYAYYEVGVAYTALYADNGSGYVAILLDSVNWPGDTEEGTDCFVAIIDTTAGTVAYSALPSNVSNPEYFGDSFYNIYGSVGIVPDFTNGTFYLICEYAEWGGGDWTYYTRVLNIAVDGSITVVKTVPEGYFNSGDGFSLFYSNTEIYAGISLLPEEKSLSIYDIKTNTLLYTIPYNTGYENKYNKRLTDADSGLIYIERETATPETLLDLSNTELCAYPYEANSTVSADYNNGWFDNMWVHGEAPVLQCGTFTMREDTINEYTRQGLGFITSSLLTYEKEAFLSSYSVDGNEPVGALIDNEISKTTQLYCIEPADSEFSAQYMDSSLGHWNTWSNQIKINVQRTTATEGGGDSSGVGSWNKIDVDTGESLGSSSNFLTGHSHLVSDTAQEGIISTNHSLQGAILAFYTPPGYDYYVNQGDISHWLEDNPELPQLTINLFSAITGLQSKSEIGVTLYVSDENIDAIPGMSIVYTKDVDTNYSSGAKYRYWNTGISYFCRVYFDDDSYYEQEKSTVIRLPDTCAGKKIDKFVFGVYLDNTNANYYIKYVVTNLVIYAAEDSRIIKYTPDGTKTILSETKDKISFGTINHVRLVGDKLLVGLTSRSAIFY